MVRSTASGDVRELDARHDLCRDLRPGNAGGLAHERHGARRARIDFEHIHDLVLDRILDVEQADHFAARCAIVNVSRRISSMMSSDRVCGGSTQALSPEWMPASSMCSMMPQIMVFSPSLTASTSTSMASEMNLSMSSGPVLRPRPAPLRCRTAALPRRTRCSWRGRRARTTDA